jgi:hypothetical protein
MPVKMLRFGGVRLFCATERVVLPKGWCRMVYPGVALDPCNIYLAVGNQEDNILYNCQYYWIAEAIRYTYCKAVEELFSNRDSDTVNKIQAVLTGWPELPTVERLPLCKTPYFSIGPILENEGTISSTYSVIDAVFTKQLELDCKKDFDGRLQLVYGNQKTVSLICIVHKEQQEATFLYNQYNWFLAVPRLFH